MDDILAHLTTEGVISAEQQEALAATLAEGGGNSLEHEVLALGVTAEALRTALAGYYGIPPFVPKEPMRIEQDVLAYIPEDSARHYKMTPIEVVDGVLNVGVNDPEDLKMQQALGFVSAKHDIPYQFVFLLEQDFKELFTFYESLTGEVDEALTTYETELDSELAEQQESEGSAEAIAHEHIKEDAPVTKIVATMLRYAIDEGASDIHIEPTDHNVVVRFRVDGTLRKSLDLPKKVQSAVVARVKILSSLRLDEKRKPQDGRFSATFEKRKIDFRVSILPTNHGEKVVMRILDNERGIASLEDTGLSPHNLAAIRSAMDAPFGIILISGPTGSGKSTTLYTMLNEMDRDTRNVLSLEDPVEYNIDGVSQSQVRPEIGYTFATGLRSALRQDPDVILVGEIRDVETAQLAIQAALTGHLVLSTIHTNNAIGVVARLIDMGIDPYLIAPTLKLAVAQRLAKRICPNSGKEEEIDESFQAMMDEEFASLPDAYRDRIPDTRTILHPEETPSCPTGTRGRIAVSETLEITDEIQSLILKHAPESDIYASARKDGFMTMKEDAIIKALEKKIPYEEVSVFGIEIGDESAVSKQYLASDSYEAEEQTELEQKPEDGFAATNTGETRVQPEPPSLDDVDNQETPPSNTI